jgi:hypothetical protein
MPAPGAATATSRKNKARGTLCGGAACPTWNMIIQAHFAESSGETEEIRGVAKLYSG